MDFPLCAGQWPLHIWKNSSAFSCRNEGSHPVAKNPNLPCEWQVCDEFGKEKSVVRQFGVLSKPLSWKLSWG